MRYLVIIFLVFVFLCGNVTALQAQDKKTRGEKRQQEFEKTQKLIESRDFIFEADRAFPQSGPPIDLTTNYGFLKVKDDSTVVGDLPFFGRAYRVDYGGDGGIKFSGKMEELDCSINLKKHRISYSFKVKDDDFFQISLDISYDGDASLNVISQNRNTIRYLGDIAERDSDEK